MFISQVSNPESFKRPGLIVETIDQEGGAVVFVHMYLVKVKSPPYKPQSG